MKTLPYTKDSYRLLHEGAIALAKVEHNGMKIDTEYLERALKETQEDIKKAQEKLSKSRVMRKWRKRFRTKTNFNSTEQLGKVLFETMKFKGEKTEKGRFKTDEASLGKIDHPFVSRYLGIKKKQKGVQFLKGIKAETVKGYLRPNFNLHLVKTFRSSSDDPNFQNLPVRNEWMKNLVRRCVIARRGHRLVEIDYSGIEVRIAACYHKDPRMLKYIKDPTTDMHRDMAMECYLLKEKEVSKAARYCAKNKFVFPQFYGSWWMDCSANLWEAIRVMDLKLPSGKSLKKHLRKKGIKELGDQDRKRNDPKPGTFERHIMEVEQRFWRKRFPVYAQWKKDWYQTYLKKGWFLTKTGFICQGFMARNDVINYPVQGSAFHCLLQALIWAVNGELEKRGLKAKVIGQIHDSIVADVPEGEVQEYLTLMRELMIDRILAKWKWINVPLEIEAEVTPVGGSWVDKAEWVQKGKTWGPKVVPVEMVRIKSIRKRAA